MMESRTSYQLKEKNFVIMEFGRKYTKCGFAGERAPRAIIKTCYCGDYLHDLTDTEELEVKLGNFIQDIYSNQLAVSPKEKKVIVVESVFTKSIFRNTLTRIFFERFNVPSLLFVPDHLMALATLGHSTGIIVDIGAVEAISIAVVEGVTLLDGAQFASIGSRTLDAQIHLELVKQYPQFRNVDPDVIEDIRVRTCFVAPFERGQKMTKDKLSLSKKIQTEAIRLAEERNQEISIGTLEGCYFLAEADETSPPSLEYALDGLKTVKIPGNLREGACELLFEMIGHEHSLTTMIVETIMMAPIDCRQKLASNILVIGGMSNLPGLEHRLYEELKHVYKCERFRRKFPDNFQFHRPLCPRNFVSWLGASIFCTPSSIDLRATNRDQWLRDGKKNPKDWSDLFGDDLDVRR